MPQRIRIFVMTMLLCAFAAPVVHAQTRGGPITGQRLLDVLRALQAQGVRLVFSTELVTPNQRVTVEPRATETRKWLDELLAPHGLEGRTGPGGIIEVVRRRRQQVPAQVDRAESPATASTADHPEPAAAGPYRESVTVTAEAWRSGEITQATARHLSAEMLEEIGSRIADDPVRTLQVLPGVATGDDVRSAVSVRGSAFRQASVIVDGVAAPWLQHAGPGRRDTGTMTMLRGDVLQEASLHVGAYPRRGSSQLGPQLNLTLREGSRAGTRVHAGVSGTSTTLTAEGPLGQAGLGSWLVAARHGNADWPLGRSDHQGTTFGFSDVQSKLIYDVTPRHVVSGSVVMGLSRLDHDSADPAVLADGFNRVALASVTWRSLVGARTVIRQQASMLDHVYEDRDGREEMAGRGANLATAYRLDVTREIGQSLIQSGVQVQRVRSSRFGRTLTDVGEPRSLANLERSAYATWRWTPTPTFTLVPAARIFDVTLTGRHAIDRTLEAEWRPAMGWLLHGSAGLVHQSPDISVPAVVPTALPLERATLVDLGVTRQLTSAIRWDVTAFARRERDVVRESDFWPSALLAAPTESRRDPASNLLDGVARGIEVTIERRRPRGLSGWVSYAYGVAQQTDPARGARFRADHDQRHTLNAAMFAPVPHGIRLSVVFRAGSNFPIPGYFLERHGRLFAGSHRNTVSLPAYARLDLRSERTIERGGRRMTLFVEALNVLNRRNQGVAEGTIVAGTGEAIGFTEPLLPRLMTAGVRVAF
jgi:TonB dependent receptor